MLVGQKVVLALVKTKNSLDADIVGIPRWTTANAAIADVEAADDGLTCQVTAKSAGSAAVTVNAIGASALNASHTIAVAAASTNLATAVAITVQSPPQLPV